MTTSTDVTTKDDFRLQKPISRASTLGISNAPPRTFQSQPNVLQRAHTVTQSGSVKRLNNRTISDRGRRLQHQRAASLHRIRRSNEDLPQRLLAHEMTSAGLRDNNFAVANVGNNGKLYLRPLVESGSRRRHGKSLPKSKPALPVSSTTLQPPRPTAGPDARHSIWSSSQFSELRPKHAHDEIAEVDSDISDAEPPRRGRAHSFSTISEYEHSVASEVGNEFRIVIDRFDAHESTNESIESTSTPALEVPIPHYRLGRLQISNEGTPILRSSLYTHTTVSGNTSSSVYLKDNASTINQHRIPSTYDSPNLNPAGTLSMAMSLFSGVAPSASKARNSSSTQKSGMYSLRHPVEPSVFDLLAANMDDPALVKYLSDSRDISAATPARIVAQISSESFMDYELVSDFFLTFRSYLSTTNLMSLLLARLEWAINRLQDDGRIIRIRAFAALRHWILNYFVDDFVSNRDLRVQFCEKINQMYDDVRGRKTSGFSDVKILVDLKRCWHGRCIMYWDTPFFASPDSPVLPGDVSDSQVFIKNNSSEMGDSSQEVITDGELSNPPLNQSTYSMISTKGGHRPARTRTVSSGTSRSVPGSLSERSVQALSCSLPSKTASIPMGELDASHPIVVSIKPSSSPNREPRSPTVLSSLRHTARHAHKRSGSFSDSIRDERAPLSQAPVERYNYEQPLLPTPSGGNGSLIRGNLFPPADASVGAFAPPSPTIPQPADELQEHHTRSSSDGNIKPLGASPALRTVIGSIRRALHTRNLGANTSVDIGTRNLRSAQGKTATLPANVAFKSDIYKECRVLPKTASQRVDHISEQSIKEYREAIGLNPPHPSVLVQKDELGESEDQTSHLKTLPIHHHQRLASEVTMGSKSIVIVDDTGLDLPVVSGGVGWLDREPTSAPRESLSSTTGVDRSSSGTDVVPSAAARELIKNKGEKSASQSVDLSTQRPSLTSRQIGNQAISSRLRKYASFHSAISRSLDASSESASYVVGKKPLNRLLRRLPGGDLRKIQNVHDLAPNLHTRSFATDMSSTESYSSLVRNYPKRSFSWSSQTRAQMRTQSTPPRFDLINTHSSQHLRPSFEAAIAEFSLIPDDDDGGIESTLLKLEGKWPSQVLSDSRTQSGIQDAANRERVDPNPSEAGASNVVSEETTVTVGFRDLPSQLYTDSVVESEFSDNSIPLLERGLSDDSMKKPVSVVRSPVTSQQFSRFPPRSSDIIKAESRPPSIQVIDVKDRIRQVSNHFDVPHVIDTPSKICDDDDIASELSSEISVDLIERDEAIEEYSSADSLATQSFEIPSHPLVHPPSPPMTIAQSAANIAKRKPETPVASQNTLTPGPSPTQKVDQHPRDNSNEVSSIGNKFTGSHLEVHGNRNHMPFVLAYDSKVLAEQFTIVEKSALDEVDWKDLVEMKWNSNSASISSWVHFLAEKEHKGIDIVVGRFNLMVKWILSEIVLTRNIQERSQTITKFIHIAVQARRICNYSTMLQIAIALSSVDCTRLQKTWNLVDPNDKRLLDNVESLIQPLRNFHELRVEMETANLQNGCIPFVGLYVHDLTYNAQKPSQVAGTRDGDALVNFERYRTSARIVKCLLRLIDASNKYELEPIPGIVEKCLWIGSLPEDQIQALSKSLE